jgi:hypothetical protein
MKDKKDVFIGRGSVEDFNINFSIEVNDYGEEMLCGEGAYLMVATNEYEMVFDLHYDEIINLIDILKDFVDDVKEEGLIV